MATTASCLAEELPAGTVIQIERPDVRQKRLYHLVKRVFDAVCALLGLLLLALPMLLIALIVALDSPGPAIFRQERLGLKGSLRHRLVYLSPHDPRGPCGRRYHQPA